jgi:prepilin-type N-terminal cleavage/methylation domain-containing protein
MLVNNRLKARGDTLIEVLFAVAIFSLVAVGGLSIMNQGTATSERALEITLVRQEIDSQAETLRFLSASYVAAYQPGKAFSDYLDRGNSTPASQWLTMSAAITNTNKVDDFGLTPTGKCPTSPAGSFIMNTHSAQFDPAVGKLILATEFAQVNYNLAGQVSSAKGIWIQAIRSVAIANRNDPQYNAGYIDFHIRACWEGPGQSLPVTIGTIVRLYEPRG